MCVVLMPSMTLIDQSRSGTTERDRRGKEKGESQNCGGGRWHWRGGGGTKRRTVGDGTNGEEIAIMVVAFLQSYMPIFAEGIQKQYIA